MSGHPYPAPLQVSVLQMAELKRLLEKILPPPQLLDQPDALERYGHDESDTADYPPQLVALPETTDQVSQVVKACHQLRIPVTPCGARSGKSGGSLPLHGGLVLSLERMRRIHSISSEDLTAVVEPGVVTGDLMKAVEEKGLFYPPDPNSWEFCTLGGNIAENAGGPRALKYGVTREYVLGLEWVLPDGEVIRVGKNTIKGVAGYDLVGLFVGSEGTLGVATSITLQLIPLPKQVQTALISFPSVQEAARAVSAVLAEGLLPRTLELLDDVSIAAVNGKGFTFPGAGAGGAAVIAEVDGNDADAVFAELAAVGEICQRVGQGEAVVAQNEEQRRRIWAVRREVSTALRTMKRFKISEDIAVPRSKIPEAIATLKRLGQERGLTVATYGHAGDGNLHANVLYSGPEERPLVDELVEQMMRLTVALGGTITGEHGVGLAKRQFLSLEQSQGVVALQRALKATIDPLSTFNPGKIFPV